MLKMPWQKKRVTFENRDGRPRKQLDREQIQLFKQQGKSNREIAKLMGCSEGTIRNRLR